mmetsp:Transcript_5764/g.11776  ORF Transcript_5764/g.11776 Transcript_5764/m.11776 type:complete len:333 (-) Transcript_5764:70-1068(-)
MDRTNNNISKIKASKMAAPLARSENTATEEGIGQLLHQIRSKHMKKPLGITETTNLQFYEHAIVAKVSMQWCCFPKRYRVFVIPRFKIVDVSFSFGPRSVSWLFYFLLMLSIILISMGAVGGGCKKACGYFRRLSPDYYSDPDYFFGSDSEYDNYFPSSDYSLPGYDAYGNDVYGNKTCSVNGGPCASLVIGCLMLTIPVPYLLLRHFFKKWHYIYFAEKAPSRAFFNFGGIFPYVFRIKRTGFDMDAGNKANLDEFYIIDYVFGCICRNDGSTVTDEAHLLSHLNHGAIATPVVPVHADHTIGRFNEKKGGGAGDAVYAQVYQGEQERMRW